MPKEPISTEDILPLCELVKNVFSFIRNLRINNELAEKIKYPQIPQILSESVALHALRKGTISLPTLENYVFEFGTKREDPDIIAAKNGEKVKIEVKATAESAFQYFSDKDISADFLIWIHFNDLFQVNTYKPVKTYVLRNPGRYINKYPKSRKLTLSRLKAIVEESLIKYEINIDSL